MEFRENKLRKVEWKGDHRDELYAHRACDSVLGLRCSVHIIEGIVGRDGTAFHHGKDILANLILVGMNPIHVDAVAAYLMGHNTQRIPYLQVAHARGLGSNNPEDIQVYLIYDGSVERCTDLSEIGRVPLGVYHRGDTSKYVFF
ncbi:MAG: hypothetical protein DRP95_05165 [Candidatus Latescibacterota bacterium]|nr:MAG: hypothetical protein DRP95_05165 [Candidatus Latescibacterota bacterium]